MQAGKAPTCGARRAQFLWRDKERRSNPCEFGRRFERSVDSMQARSKGALHIGVSKESPSGLLLCTNTFRTTGALVASSITFNPSGTFLAHGEGTLLVFDAKGIGSIALPQTIRSAPNPTAAKSFRSKAPLSGVPERSGTLIERLMLLEPESPELWVGRSRERLALLVPGRRP
jgi:hypothetical protein